MPGSEGGCGWVLVQLGESATHQSAPLRCPAHGSGQNVAPGPQVTCAGSKTAFGCKWGFPSAVSLVTSACFPISQWGCSELPLRVL